MRESKLHGYRKTVPNISPEQFLEIYQIWSRREIIVPSINEAYNQYTQLVLEDPCLIYTGSYASEKYPCFNMNKEEYHIIRGGKEQRVVLPLHQIRDYHYNIGPNGEYPEYWHNQSPSFNHSCNNKRCIVHATASTRTKNLSDTYCPVYGLHQGKVISMCMHPIKCIDLSYVTYMEHFK